MRGNPDAVPALMLARNILFQKQLMINFSIDADAFAIDEAPGTLQHRKRVGKLKTIVEDAKRVFVREGYSGFTLRKVASEAEVPLGTLQHYFSTRELLLRAVIVQTIEEYNEGYERIAMSAAPADKRLEAIMDQILTEIRDRDTRVFFLEISAVACHHAFARQAVEQAQQAYLGTLSRLVGELNPSMGARECELRALLIASQVEGLMMFSQSIDADRMPDAEPLRRAVIMVAKSLSSAG
ncbi:TetR/AcrR family transcriptional regulator [Massilia orientalis]|uniref:TetR/AcrR family transcriptional regulator n=1 Tax=Massilia orientalis TaxID=3050128 RepID=A0ACC7MMS7_9BURK|nr:TetR/AcrR family transcriptional regulator [Massilia sp. YIM B02787]